MRLCLGCRADEPPSLSDVVDLMQAAVDDRGGSFRQVDASRDTRHCYPGFPGHACAADYAAGRGSGA
jgi:hypothetical protein